MRSGPCFRVVLDTERGGVEHAEPLDDAVVEIDVGERRAAQRVDVDGVVVVWLVISILPVTWWRTAWFAPW